jgi:hypothetical protein
MSNKKNKSPELKHLMKRLHGGLSGSQDFKPDPEEPVH